MRDTRDTADLIRSLSRDQGLTILLVEHDVDLVMSLSDHVVVMHQGHKLAEGTPDRRARGPEGPVGLFRNRGSCLNRCSNSRTSTRITASATCCRA